MGSLQNGNGIRSKLKKEAAGIQRSSSKAEDPIRRKTSNAMKKLSQPFDENRLSDEYAQTIDAESTHHGPFDDSHRLEDAENAEDPAALGEEDDSDSSSSTTRGGQTQAFESVRGHQRAWERDRPERLAGQLSSEVTTTTFNGHLNTWQEWPETPLVDPLKMDKEQLQKLVASLNIQLREQQLQLDHIRAIQRNELTNKPQGLSHADLVNLMRALRTQVLRWVSTHASSYEGGISAPKNAKQFRHIVSDPNAYIKDEVYRSWLIQARLWDLLQYHIFEDDKNGDSKYYGYIWTGGRAKQTFLKKAVTQDNERVDRDMRPLDAVLRPAGTADELAWKTFLEWRASTYNLLAPPGKKMIMNSEECDAQMFLVSDRIWKSLKGFVKSSPQAYDDLVDIVWNSMLLDLDFRKQVAQFEVKRKSRLSKSGLRQYFGIPFDPATMADSNSNSRTDDGQVEITISPALFKAHDWSEGACDGTKLCLLRQEVFKSMPPRAESKSRPSLSSRSSNLDDRLKPTVVRKPPRHGLR